jgi:aldose 1-epimerase
MALAGQQYRIAAGEHEATVAEVGAGLRTYTLAGRDITVSYGDDALPPKACGAVLVPWPNRLRGGHYEFDGTELQVALTEPSVSNANHGLARWDRWTATQHDDTSVTLELDVVPQTGWPFELRVEATYALDATTGLTVSANASNRGQRRFPFGAGFHPYLATDGHRLDEVSLRVPAETRLVVDHAQIPIGRAAVASTAHDLRAGEPLGLRRFDDAFTDIDFTEGQAVVDLHAGAHRTRLWLDEVFGYLQVFTADPLIDGRPGVAVEPMTCAANAFNSGDGLLVLEPGQDWHGRWGITPD